MVYSYGLLNSGLVGIEPTATSVASQEVLLGKTSLHANHEFRARGVCERAPMWRGNP